MSLYTNNEISEFKVKKKILFKIASKILQYLRINLTKDVKVLYSENYKTWMKEIEDDTKKWKDIFCSCIVKMAMVPKAIYRFNSIPIKILMIFFTELKQIILKFICNHKNPKLPKQS